MSSFGTSNPSELHWLEKLRHDALYSQQWKVLHELILNRVNEKLKIQEIALFTDLSQTEQRIFMDELEREMQSGCETYLAFRESLGGSLDESLLRLSTQSGTGAGAHPSPALHARLAASATADLLRRRPDRLADLRSACCRGLPPPFVRR